MARTSGHGSPLGIRVDKRLLVNASHTLDGANVERILATQIAGMRRFNFAVSDIIFLLLLQRHHLHFSQHLSGFGNVTLQCRQPLLERFEIAAQPD